MVEGTYDYTILGSSSHVLPWLLKKLKDSAPAGTTDSNFSYRWILNPGSQVYTLMTKDEFIQAEMEYPHEFNSKLINVSSEEVIYSNGLFYLQDKMSENFWEILRSISKLFEGTPLESKLSAHLKISSSIYQQFFLTIDSLNDKFYEEIKKFNKMRQKKMGQGKLRKLNPAFQHPAISHLVRFILKSSKENTFIKERLNNFFLSCTAAMELPCHSVGDSSSKIRTLLINLITPRFKIPFSALVNIKHEIHHEIKFSNIESGKVFLTNKKEENIAISKKIAFADYFFTPDISLKEKAHFFTKGKQINPIYINNFSLNDSEVNRLHSPESSLYKNIPIELIDQNFEINTIKILNLGVII